MDRGGVPPARTMADEGVTTTTCYFRGSAYLRQAFMEGEALMRLFKATYRDRHGKIRESSKWYVEFNDHTSHVRRLPAFKDKRASEEFGRKLEALVALRVAGQRPDGELGRWLETLSARLLGKLAKLGILNASQAAAGKPLMVIGIDKKGWKGRIWSL